MSQTISRYFLWSFAANAVGLALAAWVGWSYSGTLEGTASIFFIALVPAALEISLSFDNAIVNANVLKRWTRHGSAGS